MSEPRTIDFDAAVPNGDATTADSFSITLDTRICWVDTLGPADPAKFEVGLQYVDIAAEDLAQIESLIKDK